MAEAICHAASKAVRGSSAVSVLRIGQLTGDTEYGVWNMSEAWPLMLSTVEALGCLPQVEEGLNWLPVDIAAKAVVEIAFHRGQTEEMCPVYHVVNESAEANWSDLLNWIGRIRSKPFSVISPKAWLDKLEDLDDHPGKSLLGLWRNAYGGDSDQSRSQALVRTSFSVVKARDLSSSMRNGARMVDEELARKIWSWLEKELQISI